jgi:hypothetical protein
MHPCEVVHPSLAFARGSSFAGVRLWAFPLAGRGNGRPEYLRASPGGGG